MWTRLLDDLVGAVVKTGTLTLTLPDGTVLRHGDGGAPQVGLILKDPALPGRLVRDPELALGEAYMDGTLEIADDALEDFFRLMTVNTNTSYGTGWFRLIDRAQRVLRFLDTHNPVGRAQRNVAHHYDLSGDLYDLFLDADRQYSCAYWGPGVRTLEEAQAAKKHHIAAKLCLEPGMRVLDVGCGWGGLALTLAQDYGVQVTGVTLSTEQHATARARVRAAGLEDRIDIRLTDYRNVEDRFDRIVSVGMFEHVGPLHYREYFTTLHRLLGADGVALVHTIGRLARPRPTSPWITRHIFPGGYIPALSEITGAVERADLLPADLEVLHTHYADTLRAWYDRFMAKADKAEALYDARFVRMWRYYLLASEAAFRHGRQVVFQVQLTRAMARVPMTRDYLYPSAGRARLAAE